MGIYVQECTCISCNSIITLVILLLRCFMSGGTGKCIRRCRWDLLPSPLSPTNRRKPQGLLSQLLRFCMSRLCCTLYSIFILNGTIKQWNYDPKGMSFTCFLPVASVHVPPSDGSMCICMPCAFKCVYSISCIAIFLAKK